MRVFVTGASGHIASAVIPELRQAGHEVAGLARSDASARAVSALGAAVVRGDLADLDGLRAAAAAADAVVHLAFDHATMMAGDFPGAVATDRAVIGAFADALAGTGKALIGVGLAASGDTTVNAVAAANPRHGLAAEIAGLTGRGVRSMLVAIPPVVHSDRDRHGFIPMLIGIARKTGVSGYAGDGANTWPAAHTLDVARLYRLALEQAPAGAQLYAATEEGIPVREIAEAIARHLGIAARGIPDDEIGAHFGAFRFIGMGLTMPNESTRRLLDWKPEHPGLIADLDEGHYFEARG